VIIMTSNIGSNVIQQNFEGMTEENRGKVIRKTQRMVFEILKQTVRPEFLNRIDEVVTFQPLSRRDIRKITRLQLNNLQTVMKKQDIDLEFTDHAMDWLAEEGFDPEFGARPLKRVIQRKVLNRLSDAILLDEIKPNTKTILDVFDGTVVFRKQPAEASVDISELIS